MPRTDATTPGKQRIIDALTSASVQQDDGVRYIRAATACRIIGVGYGQRTQWEAAGKIEPVRFRVSPRVGASIGVVVAWPLSQVIACVRARKPMSERRWTESDEDRLLTWLGRYRVEVIARKLGRTATAVRVRAYSLGVNTRTNAGNLTTGEVAGLCRRSRQAVQEWCLKRGLPFRRMPNAKGEKLIKPEDLCAFLKSRPKIWSGLPEASRRHIERMGGPVVLSSPSTREPRTPRVCRTSGASGTSGGRAAA